MKLTFNALANDELERAFALVREALAPEASRAVLKTARIDVAIVDDSVSRILGVPLIDRQSIVGFRLEIVPRMECAAIEAGWASTARPTNDQAGGEAAGPDR